MKVFEVVIALLVLTGAALALIPGVPTLVLDPDELEPPFKERHETGFAASHC